MLTGAFHVLDLTCTLHMSGVLISRTCFHNLMLLTDLLAPTGSKLQSTSTHPPQLRTSCFKLVAYLGFTHREHSLVSTNFSFTHYALFMWLVSVLVFSAFVFWASWSEALPRVPGSSCYQSLPAFLFVSYWRHGTKGDTERRLGLQGMQLRQLCQLAYLCKSEHAELRHPEGLGKLRLLVEERPLLQGAELPLQPLRRSTGHPSRYRRYWDFIDQRQPWTGGRLGKLARKLCHH